MSAPFHTGVLVEALRGLVLGLPLARMPRQIAVELERRGLLSSEGAITPEGNALLAEDGDRAFREIAEWLRGAEAEEFFRE